MSDAVADELAIRNLVARYSDAVNSRDRQAFHDSWAKDGEWRLLGQTPKGRDHVVALWEKLMGSLPFVLQLVYSGTVEIDGDAGTGRWYLSEINRGADGTPGSLVGVYHDRYVRELGNWCFQSRRFDMLYYGPPDLSGKIVPFPADV